MPVFSSILVIGMSELPTVLQGILVESAPILATNRVGARGSGKGEWARGRVVGWLVEVSRQGKERQQGRMIDWKFFRLI